MILNDQPPKVDVGDEVMAVVRIRCSCGALVGRVVLNIPLTGSGRKPIFYAELQAIEDIGVRPVRTRTVLVDLLGHETVLTDCQAHGRITLTVGALMVKARQVIAHQESQTRTVDAVPDGLPIGHDLTSTAMSAEAFRRIWDSQRRV